MLTRIYAKILSLLEMVVGTALSAAAFSLIIIPQGFAAGGVTGFSRIICQLFGWNLSATVLVINLALLLAGLVFVNRAFAAKTVSLSVLFPVMLELFSRVSLTELNSDSMISAIIAAVLLGGGTGLILRSGASSGGFDIVAVILNRKFRLPIAAVINIFDCSVILMQAVGQPLMQTIYGILVIMMSTKIVNYIVTSGQGQSQLMIFSEHFEEIRNMILHKFDVGMTSFHAETGYAQKETKTIVTIIPYSKVSEIKKQIMAIDPSAFVVVSDTHSVLGRGYTLDKHFISNEFV